MPVWLEMKRYSGHKISDEQKAIHERLDELEHVVIVAHGSYAAVGKLMEAGVI